MIDLHNTKYDISFLEKNIYNLNLLDLIKTQKLTINFVLKFVLNKNYQLTKEEENITIMDILKYKSHLKEKYLLEKYKKLKKNKTDSFFTFD